MNDVIDRAAQLLEDDQYASMFELMAAEIERLRAAGHEAFMAMCAYRDNADREVFQNAIDALGMALNAEFSSF